MERIGLLAGAGRLPVECARAARNLGYEVYAVALLKETDKELKEVATQYEEISIGKFGKIFDYIKKNEIKKVTMLGKVTKELLFSGMVIPDFKAIGMLAKLHNKSDDTIMKALVDELAKVGAEVLDQTMLIRPLMPKEGKIAKREPTDEEKKDIEFGLKMAKELGRIDVGQTVVVKDCATMALEAIEGTDECIKRGGKLARGGAVVVKTAKPNQDNRFDVPAVGVKTIESMILADATVLAIEAERTLLVERDEVIKLADKHKIAVVAVSM